MVRETARQFLARRWRERRAENVWTSIEAFGLPLCDIRRLAAGASPPLPCSEAPAGCNPSPAGADPPI